MYLVVIAWLYVVLMMSITERSIVAGLMTFVFFGLAPCMLLVWLFGGPGRARAKRLQAKAAEVDLVANENMHQPDRGNAEPDQRKLVG
jgi:hypothetical protein